MYQRKPRRFRRRSNGRSRHMSGGDPQARLRFNSFTNGQMNNRFNPTQSAEKLFEKYNTLAKEALSSGDKTLSENYFQHADHFMRIIEYKKSQNKVQDNVKLTVEDKSSTKNSNTEQDLQIKEKKE